MTSISIPLDRHRVLADLLMPRATAARWLAVILGAGLTAIAAQVAIPVPGSPVPVTGQTFAVLLAGAALGPARGLASQVVYLILGAVGLPVFTQGAHGAEVVFGATGGYLVGFLFAALIAGAASRRGADRSPLRELGVAIAATSVIYLLGVTWLSHSTGMTTSAAIAAGVTPFIVGDAAKALLVAGLLPTAWKLVALIEASGSDE